MSILITEALTFLEDSETRDTGEAFEVIIKAIQTINGNTIFLIFI